MLEPTGQNNRSPLFVSYKVDVRGARTVGKDKSHLKLILSQDGVTFDAIAFRFGHLVNEIPGQIDILYAFEMNEFNGTTNPAAEYQRLKIRLVMNQWLLIWHLMIIRMFAWLEYYRKLDPLHRYENCDLTVYKVSEM